MSLITAHEVAGPHLQEDSVSALEEMARVAWRNSDRCIGRLYWNTLQLLDGRAAKSPQEVFEACVQHLEHSTHGGRIIPTITVFAPALEGERGMRIWNSQLIRYAGYRAADGRTLGDPLNMEFTTRVMAMGWQPPRDRSAFDLLPLVVECPGYPVRYFELPRHAVLEVPLSHPEFAWFAGLGIKWHAVPAISDMVLVGNGQRFTAAPFSGHYMGTEIGSRNLGDEARYNLLPVIADHLGIDRQRRCMLWKDRALVELNTAVLHSFREAGVTIIDHHTASEHFMRHIDKEMLCGREVPGDWSWLVPPMSGSSCRVFHRYYDSARPEPAFVKQDSPW